MVTLEDVLANDSSTLTVYANVKLSVYRNCRVDEGKPHHRSVGAEHSQSDVSGIF